MSFLTDHLFYIVIVFAAGVATGSALAPKISAAAKYLVETVRNRS
jgi:hypothetical protein